MIILKMLYCLYLIVSFFIKLEFYLLVFFGNMFIIFVLLELGIIFCEFVEVFVIFILISC